MKFLILQEGTLRLILPFKEGQNLDPEKTWIKKKHHQIEAFWFVKHVTSESSSAQTQL